MGKLTGSGGMRFAAFLFLFAISVALDFEYDVYTLDGGGEVLAQSRQLVGDVLVRPKEIKIPIKLLDVITLVLLVIVFFNKEARLFLIKNATDKKALWRLIVAASLFYLWCGASIFINEHDYTKPQVIVMVLHLVKLMQVTVIGVMVALLVRRRNIGAISSPLLLGFLLASVALIVNKSGLVSMGDAAGDRMETFGGIIMSIILFFYLYHIEVRNEKMNSLKRLLYFATIFVSSIAILTSGKRGVEFAFIVCLVPLLSGVFFNRTATCRKMKLAFFAGLVVSMPNIVYDFSRSVGQAENSIEATSNKTDILNAYFKLYNIFQLSAEYPHASKQLNLAQKEIRIPIVSTLDRSGAERIGRYVMIMNLIPNNALLGSGFWGVQYKYGVLLDSGFQVLLETGLIGATLFLMLMYLIWHVTAADHDCIRRPALHYLLVAFVALVVLSIFCNPFYMNRLVLNFMFFTTLLAAEHFPNNTNKITAVRL